MKITLVNQASIPDSEPGITRHHAYAKALVALGHEVTIVAGSFNHFQRREIHLADGERMRAELIDGVTFLWLKIPPYGQSFGPRLWSMAHFGLAVRAARRHAAFREADIILGSTPYPMGTWAALGAARANGKAFVLEIRDIWPMTIHYLGGVSQWNPIMLFLAYLERRLIREADGIVSTLAKGELRVRELAGAKANDCVWIPNGIDPALVGLMVPPSAEAPFEFLYAGLLSEQSYALGSILDAAKLLLEDFPPEAVKVTIIGEGPSKALLQNRVSKEGFRNVFFEAALPKKAIYGRMARAHAFIYSLHDSPLYRYGTSCNKLGDYLVSGRPTVFASPLADDLVGAADAGVCVEPEDAHALAEGMRRVLAATPEMRRQWGEHGRAYILDCFAIPDLARTLLGVFEDARANRGASGTMGERMH
jgi:glycosyltransferase involved in cell wall biosynthesis